MERNLGNGRSIEHVDASNVQLSVLAAKQLDDSKTQWGSVDGEFEWQRAVQSFVERLCPEQIEVTGSIELPDDERLTGEHNDFTEQLPVWVAIRVNMRISQAASA